MSDFDIKDAAMHFEAVKVSMSQDRNGIILRLNVHPNDCPKDLHTDWVGTRYVVAMVKLREDDTVDDRGAVAIQRLVASAGMLSRNEEFFAFLVAHGKATHTDDPWEMEQRCADAIRQECRVQSRSEFRDNETARARFEALRQEFTSWKRDTA